MKACNDTELFRIAIIKGVIEDVKWLVENRYENLDKYYIRFWPLVCICSGSMNIAEYLLSIWGPTGFNSCSFLTTAIIESSYDKLVWLVEKAGFWFGLLNTFDYEMVASALASRGEVKVVQFFVKHGFDFSFDMCFWSMCVKTSAFEVMDYIEYIRNECPYLMERDRKRYDTWKKLRNQVKIKAVNKIYFWWGPILRRINPGFVLREAEESYEKLRTTFLQG